MQYRIEAIELIEFCLWLNKVTSKSAQSSPSKWFLPTLCKQKTHEKSVELFYHALPAVKDLLGLRTESFSGLVQCSRKQSLLSTVSEDVAWWRGNFFDIWDQGLSLVSFWSGTESSLVLFKHHFMTICLKIFAFEEFEFHNLFTEPVSTHLSLIHIHTSLYLPRFLSSIEENWSICVLGDIFGV